MAWTKLGRTRCKEAENGEFVISSTEKGLKEAWFPSFNDLTKIFNDLPPSINLGALMCKEGLTRDETMTLMVFFSEHPSFKAKLDGPPLVLVKDDSIPSKSYDTVGIEKVSIHPTANVRMHRSKEDVERMAKSIEDDGFGYPLRVVANDGRYPELHQYLCFDGGFRLDAAKMAGAKKVPIQIEQEVTELELVLRSFDSDDKVVPLTAIEEAKVFEKVLAKVGSKEEVANRVGRTSDYVEKRLKLLELPKNVQEMVLTKKLSANEAHEIACQPKKLQQKITERKLDEKKETKVKKKKGTGIFLDDLPQGLLDSLKELAKDEGVKVKQYIVRILDDFVKSKGFKS